MDAPSPPVPPAGDDHIAVEVIRKQHYDSEPVPLDGRLFADCTFKDCELVYSGEAPFSFHGKVVMRGENTIAFVGSAANALSAVSLFAEVGMLSVEDLVEPFQNIFRSISIEDQ